MSDTQDSAPSSARIAFVVVASTVLGALAASPEVRRMTGPASAWKTGAEVALGVGWLTWAERFLQPRPPAAPGVPAR